MWTGTSTLYITIYDGHRADGPVLQRGVLNIAIADFTKQLATMQIADADSMLDKAGALARLGIFFAGELCGIYGINACQRQVLGEYAGDQVRLTLPEICFLACLRN